MPNVASRIAIIAVPRRRLAIVVVGDDDENASTRRSASAARAKWPIAKWADLDRSFIASFGAEVVSVPTRCYYRRSILPGGSMGLGRGNNVRCSATPPISHPVFAGFLVAVGRFSSSRARVAA